MGVTKSEILLAKLNTFFQRINPKNIFGSIHAYYKTYENYKDVLLNIIRGKYPFEARLRTGEIVKIDNHVSAYFFTVYFTKLQNPDFSSDVLEFIFDSRKVSFYGWKYGGIIDAFGRHDYDFLNVENKTVVDIGAFIGDTAIYFALKGAKRVIAFEPFPKFFYLAQKNVNVNNVNDKVILINAGCGYDGKVRVKEDSGSNAASVLINQEEGIEIPTYSLDTITSSFDVEDGSVLKIDCEGCEYELFKRATDNAFKKFNQIQIEYHYGHKELENRLKRAGFKVRHSIPKIVQVNDGQIVGYIYAWK